MNAYIVYDATDPEIKSCLVFAKTQEEAVNVGIRTMGVEGKISVGDVMASIVEGEVTLLADQQGVSISGDSPVVVSKIKGCFECGYFSGVVDEEGVCKDCADALKEEN